MADPLDYTLVRVDNNIRHLAVLSYDAQRDMLVDSGLVASHGELQAAAGSVAVGTHSMESSGEQVMWTNQATGVTFAPAWHVIDESNPGGSYDRFYGPKQTIVRFAERSTIVIDPVMNVIIPVDTMALSFNFTWPEAQPGVVLEWYAYGSQQALWRAVQDVSQGTQDFIFKTPLAYHAGNYVFKMYRLDGQPLKVMGNPVTGYAGYSVTLRQFTDKPLATQEYVNTHAGSGGGTGVGDMLKSVYDSNNDGRVDRADVADGLSGTALSPVSTYYGKNAAGAVGFHPIPDVANVETELNTFKTTLNAHSATLQTQGQTLAAQDTTLKAHAKELQDHETAIENHGAQLADHASRLAVNTKNISVVQAANAVLTNEQKALRASAVAGLTVNVDNTAKTLTMLLKTADGTTVDTAHIDLATWFSGSPPVGADYKLYAGFAVTVPLNEAAVISNGKMITSPTINGLDIVLTRTPTTPSYMWVWLPDTVGVVKGFNFSGFLSTWSSTALSVSGIPGKFFVSPQQTTATSVSFEVTL